MTAVVAPHRHVPVERQGSPDWAAAIELAAPLALGQRYLVTGRSGSGRTTVLRTLASALESVVDDLVVVVVDGRPEELAEWRRGLRGAELAASTSDRDVAEHAGLADRFAHAFERAAGGRHVAVVVDTLASLARAIDAAAGPEAGPVLECGLAATSLASTRQAFASARAWEGAGSLTVVAAVGDRDSEVDTVLLEELVGTGNADLVLVDPATSGGLVPAIDLGRSGSRHEDQILGVDEANRRARLRGMLLDHEGLGGYSLLLDEVNRRGTLNAVIERAIGSA